MKPGPPVTPTSIAPITIASTSIGSTSDELRIAVTDTDARDPQAPVRLDVRRLTRLVVYALILPGGSAIAFDFWLGLFPLLTLGTMVVLFPIAAFIILRSTLREMNHVIDQVAPEVAEPEASALEATGNISDKSSETFHVEAKHNSKAGPM